MSFPPSTAHPLIGEFAATYFPLNQISPERQEEYWNTLDDIDRFVHRYRTSQGWVTISAGTDTFGASPLTAAEFEAWMAELLKKDFHVNTVRKKATIVRTFVRFWTARQRVWDDLEGGRIIAVRNPRGSTGRSDPNPYAIEEIEALYAWIDREFPVNGRYVARWRGRKIPGKPLTLSDSLMNYQLRAIVALALDAGLRRREIFAGTIHDFSAENIYVQVREGKSTVHTQPKQREVPMNDHLRAAMEVWLPVRRLYLARHGNTGMTNHDSPWITLRWPNFRGRGTNLGEAMGYHAFRALLRPGGFSLHRLRHTSATLWLRSGVPLEQVRRMMGHATLEQTLCYAKLVREDLHASVTECSATFERLAGL